jgi:hypothetical protein
MTPHSTTEQNFIDGQLDAALSRHRLPHSHPIRTLLEDEAVMAGTRQPCVRCGNLSLDDRIAQLKDDARFAHSFPHPGGKVSKNDMATMRTRFDEIASGRVRVE